MLYLMWVEPVHSVGAEAPAFCLWDGRVCHLDLRWLVSLWNVNLNAIREPADGLVGVWGRVWGWQGPGNVPVDLKGHPEALKFYGEGGAIQQSY